MTVNKRIKYIIDAKGLNKNSFSVVVGIQPQTLHHIIGGRLTKPSFEILNKIISTFSDINPIWLIKGEGNPFLSPQLSFQLSVRKNDVIENESPTKTTQIFEETQSSKEFDKDQKKFPLILATTKDRACHEEQLIIEGLKTQLIEQKQGYERIVGEKDNVIRSQDKQIEALECQIEDLKNNLGMVISEKSEVIKMKDEMLAMKEEAIKGKEATLAAKDETIRIQSRRISELESHNEAEDLKKILGTSERIGQENISLTDIHPKDLSTKSKKGEYKV